DKNAPRSDLAAEECIITFPSRACGGENDEQRGGGKGRSPAFPTTALGTFVRLLPEDLVEGVPGLVLDTRVYLRRVDGGDDQRDHEEQRDILDDAGTAVLADVAIPHALGLVLDESRESHVQGNHAVHFLALPGFSCRYS